MSDRGVHAWLVSDEESQNCLLIGKHVPRVHHSDGIPVYLVVEHPRGIPTIINNGGKTPAVKNLLAYPSHWVGPGKSSGRWIFAYREPMPFNAMLPVFDDE